MLVFAQVCILDLDTLHIFKKARSSSTVQNGYPGITLINTTQRQKRFLPRNLSCETDLRFGIGENGFRGKRVKSVCDWSTVENSNYAYFSRELSSDRQSCWEPKNVGRFIVKLGSIRNSVLTLLANPFFARKTFPRWAGYGHWTIKIENKGLLEENRLTTRKQLHTSATFDLYCHTHTYLVLDWFSRDLTICQDPLFRLVLTIWDAFPYNYTLRQSITFRPKI